MGSGGSGGKLDRSNQSMDVRPHGEVRVVAVLSSYFIWTLNPKPVLQHSESLLEIANVNPISPKMSMTLQQEGNLLLLGNLFSQISQQQQAEIQSHCARDLGSKAWNAWISRMHVPSLECFWISRMNVPRWNAWISRIYILILECLEFQKVYSELECFDFPRL